MASIFQSAAAALRSRELPTQLPLDFTISPKLSNTKRPRFQLSPGQAQQPPGKETPRSYQRQKLSSGISWSSGSLHATTPPSFRFERVFPSPALPESTFLGPGRPEVPTEEPISSGFTSPIPQDLPVQINHLVSGWTARHDSDDDDYHSTHGVPYIIAPPVPVLSSPHQNPSIFAWLDKMVIPTPDVGEESPTLLSAVEATDPSSPHPTRSSPSPLLVSRRLRGTIVSPCPREPFAKRLSPVTNTTYRSILPWNKGHLNPDYNMKSSPRHSSNKENRSPQTVAETWSSLASSVGQERDRSSNCEDEFPPKVPGAPKFRRPGVPDTISYPTFSTPSTLRSPPRRTRAKAPAALSDMQLKAGARKRQDRSTFDICKDDGTSRSDDTSNGAEDGETNQEEVVSGTMDAEMDSMPLSPGVERYRKGQGPRRERCTSYWDGDIVPKIPQLRQDTADGKCTGEALEG
ncbi:hypothetical protein MMC19_006051 [Ptychographa xylographoides]|nr:hypothetical protein [Ptychographa xylographoides]